MAAAARVTWSDGVVHLRDDRLFGAGGERHLGRLVWSVLGVEDVLSITLDRAGSTAAIRHDAGRHGLVRLLEKIAAAVRTETPSQQTPTLPRVAREGSNCTIFRRGSLLSTCEVVADRPGRLRLRHEAIGMDHPRAELGARLLAEVPGVRSVTVDRWSGESWLITYDPASIDVPRLVRLAEDALEDPGAWASTLEPATKTRFGLANTNLGLAAIADFAIPALAPASAILLLATNSRTIRVAILQFRRRTLGLPALYVTIVTATLLSGQFFAWALMSWLFKFWHGRLRIELARERKRVLDECLPLPRRARIITSDGIEILVPSDRLRLGDRFVVHFGESIPADGRVVEGEAIVDERCVKGLTGSSRKLVGDRLLAGSVVLVGSIRGEVAGHPDRTRASTIGRALVAATSPSAGPFSPTLRAEAFADRAVAPTLATAGLGFLLGGLPAAGAILRPDYATGPGLAFPLELLRDAAFCARKGIVVRSPDVFDRLASADLIVIEDSPALHRRGLEIAGIRASLAESDLLRLAASAFRHVADDRATALADACRARHIYLLDVPASGFDSGVTVEVGRRKIRVRDHLPGAGRSGPLVVEVDGTPVALIQFATSSKSAAEPALRRLRGEIGLPIVLASDRPEAEAEATARSVGADVHRGDLSPVGKAKLLRTCRDRGLKAVFVGDCRRQAEAAAEAYVAVSIGDDADLDTSHAAALLLQPRYELLADLWGVARSHAGRVRTAQNTVLLPNLLCVAGAFFFGATALTSVVVTSLGTFGVYNRAIGSLRGPDRARP